MSNQIQTQTYQCTICRRVKSETLDSSRAIPNQCTITKGCRGILNPVAGRVYSQPQPGLIDWYPRNKKPLIKTEVNTVEEISMATSSGSAITLALFLTDAEAADITSVRVNFDQRLSADTVVVNYNFVTTSATLSFSGRDSQGRNLRFDQNAIDDNRVVIIVNGVRTEAAQLTPNVVTFLTPVAANSTVDIAVYESIPSTNVTMLFQQNNAAAFSAATTAWTNIRWVVDNNSVQVSDKKWWVYTATTLGTAGYSAFLRPSTVIGINITGNEQTLSSAVLGFDNVRFLLAASPYGNVDRYLQFFIDVTKLSMDWLLRTGVSASSIFSQASALVELYPPMSLLRTDISFGSFISDDVNTGININSVTDTPSIISNKILGPV